MSPLRFHGWVSIALLVSVSTPASLGAAEFDLQRVGGTVSVDAPRELSRLLRQMDVDRDKKITVGDKVEKPFWLLESGSGSPLEVSGVYPLSNLLQELKLASDEGAKSIRAERVFENPVMRISRAIREIYWDHLTRRVDADHLAQVLVDPKLPKSEWKYLYVPFKDQLAFDHFSEASQLHPELKLKVIRLPEKVDGRIMQEIRGRHGLLTLGLRKDKSGALEGVPFVVPGGRFNEMYGWDSYFESLGLIADGRVDLARAMVDNFVYQIENYGKILNANRSYYLNRSQPPFLTSLIQAVYDRLDKNEESRQWLARSLRAAIREYFSVWMSEDRLTEIGLSRYFGDGHGIPPEVEKGHFDFILKPAAKRHHLSEAELERRYNSGQIQDSALDEFFAHDRAVRESGHDTTYRWQVNGKDRAADFVTVDLNSLLYKYEIDIARIIRKEFHGEFTSADGKVKTTGEEWTGRARKRRELILRYLWNPERKMFFDYRFKDKVRSNYVSATAFYPLWAQDPKDPATRILGEEDAQASLTGLLAELEMPGGIASTSPKSLREAGQASGQTSGEPRRARQWEYPNGWAPHQMIAWSALKNYGRNADLTRLTYRWLYTITRNAADYNGTVPEKFDVMKRSHAVFAEYGNVGTQFSYITQEGFGWMNASYQVGLEQLAPVWRAQLEGLVPPEWLRFGEGSGR